MAISLNRSRVILSVVGVTFLTGLLFFTGLAFYLLEPAKKGALAQTLWLKSV